MLAFLRQNIATIIIAALVFGTAALVILRMVRNRRRGTAGGCGGCGGCDGCPSASACHPQAEGPPNK